MTTKTEELKVRCQELRYIWEHLPLGEVSVATAKIVAAINAFFNVIDQVIQKGDEAKELELSNANNALIRIDAHLKSLAPQSKRPKFKL